MDNRGNDEPNLDELMAMDATLQRLARELHEDARAYATLIERVLRALPLQRVRVKGVTKLRVVFSRDTEEHLRDACDRVASVDGHALGPDALLATLALAALRGPDELRELAIDEESEAQGVPRTARRRARKSRRARRRRR